MEPNEDQIPLKFLQTIVAAACPLNTHPRNDFHGAENEEKTLKEQTEADYFFPLLFDESDEEEEQSDHFPNPMDIFLHYNDQAFNILNTHTNLYYTEESFHLIAPSSVLLSLGQYYADIDEIDPPSSTNPTLYFNHLSQQRVQMSDWPRSQSSDQNHLIPEGLHRVTKEIQVLSKSLPCESSGSIFFHFDSADLSRCKVLVSGPEGTPYEHGLYLFEVLLPGNYPLSPPKVTLMTTGNGRVRFNPNLYETGFVCLSIINTWAGSPDEMWNPSISSLLQVFISIQSLVMDNHIVQKEPGYSKMSQNSPENIDYCNIIKYSNMAFAMLEMIRFPPQEFKDTVLMHFSIKKHEIVKTLKEWEFSFNELESTPNSIVFIHNIYTAHKLLRDAKAEFVDLMNLLIRELDKLPEIG